MVTRLALVGLGDIGQSAHLPAMLRAPDVVVAACVDPDAGRRRAAAALAPDAASYEDIRSVLADDSVRGVVLATPPWVTTSLVPRILATGRHVLAEKPIATSVAAAAELTALPAEQRNRLQVGLTYRHDPALDHLRQLIADDVLGKPLLVRAHIYDERNDVFDPEHGERLRKTLEHGAPVMHEGSHVFDWLRFLLGGPVDRILDAWRLWTDPEFAQPNLIGARLAGPDGATALVEFGWLTDALPPCQVTVLGQRGYAVLDSPSFRLTVTIGAESEEVAFAGDRTARSFDRQLERFVTMMVFGCDEPSPNLADGLAALALSERVVALASRE